MKSFELPEDFFRQFFVLVFLLLVLIFFLFLIRDLIIPVILAATLSGLLYPFCTKIAKPFKGRRTFASVLTLLIALIVVVIPIAAILVIAAKEALEISKSIMPWLDQQMNKPPEQWMTLFEGIPFIDQIKPFQSTIMEGLSQLLQKTGNYLTGMFSAATVGTVGFIFKTFIFLYSAFYFLNDGERMLKTISGYLPFTEKESQEITEKGLHIIRATIKSLFVIGAIQGSLVTIAFLFLGIKGAFFLGTVAAVLSAIPGLGAPIVWVPVVVYLILSDRLFAGIGLAVWGAFVVGLVDNLLRPTIIGREAKVPELLIFLSILGGLATLGLAGLIIGPVVVSVLISAIEIYVKVFRPKLSSGKK